MASRPLASSAASSAAGTAPDRSRSITPGAIEAAYSRAALIASAPEPIAGRRGDPAPGRDRGTWAEPQRLGRRMGGHGVTSRAS